MQIEFTFLAETARFDEGDKLSAHNIGFNAVRVTGVPTVMTSLVAVVCVRYEPDEFGQLHAIEERAVSPDGEFAGPAANAMFTPVTVAVRPGGNPERPESPYYHRQVFALDGMLLSDYGMYEIRILLDGNEVTTLYFEVQRDG